MAYKKKLLFLLSLVGLLSLVYIGTLVFEPERVNTRNASFVWLPPELQDQADGIEITGNGAEPLVLERRGGLWVVPVEGVDYPARQGRVQDLLGLLSKRGAYPVRAGSAASHERLGLTEDTADRILIRGGAGLPLLDLLIGHDTAAQNEIYMRKNGQDEVRSGETAVSSYIGGARTAWYNLRLFPEGETQPLDITAIQRITVLAPPIAEDSPAEPLVLSRNAAAGGWTLEGGGDTPPDSQRIDSYLRSIVDAEGEDFIPSMGANDQVYNEGRIVLEMGNGAARTIRVGPLIEGNRRSAVVSGSPYVYALAEWTISRIFRDGSYFVTQ
ncbi:MAG: DUF4340 domain-containing protein [Treponema sp.]|jgi:hypothetical protein|nr:DUF4340 domain-containing protein [Treponema sp.]